MTALEIDANWKIDDNGTSRALSVDDLLALPAGAATQATLAAVLAKLSSDPATAAGVTAIVTKLGTTLSVESSSVSKGYEQVTLSAEASTLTIPSGATKALAVATADVRWRDDGTDPTATVGYPLPAMTELDYDGDQLDQLVFFGTATIDVHYFA